MTKVNSLVQNNKNVVVSQLVNRLTMVVIVVVAGH